MHETVLPYDRKVVKETIDFASARWAMVYQRLEGIPMLQQSIQRVDESTQWITKPVLKKITEFSEPWVVTVDDNISQVLKSINDRVLVPVKSKGSISASGVIGEVQSIAQIELKNRYSIMLDYTDDCVDYWLPTEGEAGVKEENSKDVQSVGVKLSKRLRDRIDHQWAYAQELSSTKLKSVIHVDLIDYAKKMNHVYVTPVTEASKAYVSDVYSKTSKSLDPVAENMKLAVDSSKDWVASKQVAVRTLMESSRDELLQRYSETLKTVRDRAEKAGLVKKMENAIIKARTLSFNDLSDFTLVRLHVRTKNDGFEDTESRVMEFLDAVADAVFLKTILVKGKSYFTAASSA